MKARVITKDSERAALLKRLSDEGVSLMFFYEEAPPASIPHEAVGDEVWLIHPPYGHDQLEKWLYLGNWQAISPGNRAYRPFNSFKSDAAEIAVRLREAGVKLLIDSFHDDREWHVIEDT